MLRYEHYLDRSASCLPDKIAVIQGEQSLTYQQWVDASNQFALALIEQGVQRGDRVVIFLESCLQTAIAIFGTMKAGAVFSVVNATTKSDKLAFILNNCRATALVAHRRLLLQATTAAESATSLKSRFAVDMGGQEAAGWLDFDDSIKSTTGRTSPEAGVSLDLAMVMYTSGSTGVPKGVMMTHENIDAASWSITTYLKNTQDDVILCALPLSFDYGLYQLLMSCRVGATLVLEKSFTYPSVVLETARRWQVTGFPLVPTMAALLVQMGGAVSGTLPHLRYISNTGAALPPVHILKLQEMFPSAEVFSMYGLTECKRCTYLPPEQLAVRPSSVGIAIPGTEAYVLNDRDERIKPGEVGTLYIRGRTVMQGYWENEAETAKMLKPGLYPWEKVLCTNDLFTIDDDGFLYFMGRSDDIIKTRGEKVSPKEVEAVLYGIDGVVEALVIGEPDSVFGAVIKAFVVLAPGCVVTEREVLRHCAGHLEAFMVPKSVEFREALPKTDSGKLRRAGL